jgi:2-aminoadipate transaminase
MAIDWQHLYAERSAGLSASGIREILKVSGGPDFISLAGGLPAPELFPVDEIRRACEFVLESAPVQALQYGATEGYDPLRAFIAERLGGVWDIQCTADEVLITNGSQQALDLMGRLFVNPGDAVVVEDPSYVAALQAFAGSQARFVVAPTDEDGLRTDALEDLLRRERVKFIYLIPTFQNPSGRTLSLERRHHLIELSRRYHVPIVEDDPYGELRFEGDSLPPLRALDQDGGVLYLGTFSKILDPGMRVGWVVAPRPVLDKLVLAKQPIDLHTGMFQQMVTYQVIQDGFLERHVPQLRPLYRERRDALLGALERYFPSGEATWTRPQGGLFVWATLPVGCDALDFFREASVEEVAFVPGESFHPRGDVRNTLRLNFSNASPRKLEEAVQRLARAFGRCWRGAAVA